MTTIRSGTRQPASFKGDHLRSSFAILLTDYKDDAGWRLRIECKTEDGGYFVLGAVDTIPIGALVPGTRSANRVIAVCAVPGVIEWLVYYNLIAGKPTPGDSSVSAEIKFSATEEYGGSCCPLVAVPGNAVNVNVTSLQTPTGPPPTGTRVTLYSGSGFALAADVTYNGLGAAPLGPWAQLHDAGAAEPLSNLTMIGPGYPFKLPATQMLLLQWKPGRRFEKGFTIALSTAQNTFVASTETVSTFGQWSTYHD